MKKKKKSSHVKRGKGSIIGGRELWNTVPWSGGERRNCQQVLGSITHVSKDERERKKGKTPKEDFPLNE